MLPIMTSPASMYWILCAIDVQPSHSSFRAVTVADSLSWPALTGEVLSTRQCSPPSMSPSK